MRIGFKQLLIIVILGFVIFYTTRTSKNKAKEDEIRTYPKERMYAKKRNHADFTEVIDVEIIEPEGKKAKWRENSKKALGDLRLALIILGVAILLYAGFNILSTDNDLVANIYVKGELVKTVDLSVDTGRTAVTPYIDMVYIVHDNGIEVIHSDCDDEVCVNTGLITKSYQVIACVPNQVIIEIVDPDSEKADKEDDNSDLDGVVR